MKIGIEGTPAKPPGHMRKPDADFYSDDVLTRLRAWGSLQIGEMPPADLGMNWGVPMTKVLNDAADEIERLRAMVAKEAAKRNEQHKWLTNFLISTTDIGKVTADGLADNILEKIYSEI